MQPDMAPRENMFVPPRHPPMQEMSTKDLSPMAGTSNIPTEPVNPNIIESPPPTQAPPPIVDDGADVTPGDPNKNKYEALFKALDQSSGKRGGAQPGGRNFNPPTDGKTPTGPPTEDCPWQLMQQKSATNQMPKTSQMANQIPQSNQTNQQQQNAYPPTTPEAQRQIPQVITILQYTTGYSV